jgi:hypothetical protein
LRDFDLGDWRFALLNWHRRARKSTLAINLLIRECCTHPKKRFGYVTSTYTAAKNIIWRDPNMLKKYLPEALVLRTNESELYVEFKNGSILSIHGSDKADSLRGIDFWGVVLDEFALMKPMVWDEIIRPIIAQDKRRWAMFTFTPKGRNHAFRMWTQSKDQPGWKRYELRGEDSLIIPHEELVSLKKEIPSTTYAQEIQVQFNEDSSGVFKGVDNCISGSLEEPKKGFTYVTGVDLAKVHDFSVVTTLCRETHKVVAFRRFNQLDWSIQKEAIIAETRKYNSMAVVDTTGVGEPIFEDLKKSGINVMAYQITAPSKKELIDRLVVAIEQRLITFPNIEVMVDELKNYAYEITLSHNIRYAAPEGMFDDCVISLALAVYGMRNFMYGKKVNERVIRPKATTNSNIGFGFGNK